MGSVGRLRVVFVALVSILLLEPVNTQANIDGGRSDLPGMKQDIFDQVNRQKKMGNQPQRGKAPPECPKSDMMSPWYSLAFVGKEVYVRVDSKDGNCVKLLSVGGANYANLTNASKTCGPVGEWKRRIAENLSSMFFQAGLEWVKSENQTLEVVTEDGTSEAVVNEEKYAAMLDCWKYSCGCEQAKNPAGKAVLIALFVIAVGGLSYDSLKVIWAKIVGKQPPKHVECKNGHRLEEVNNAARHYCDVCGSHGTQYRCTEKCNYDLCKKCYKTKKKEVKAEWEKWCEKHPEDKKKKKSEKDDEDKEDDDKKSDAEEKNASEKETSEKETSEASEKEASEKETSGKETSGGDEEKDETEPESKDAGEE